MAALSLIFDIIGKDNASKAFDDVGGSAEKSGGKLGKFGTAGAAALGGFAGSALGGAIEGFKSFAGGAVDAFAAVEDATGAAGVQFGKQLPAVVAFADGASKSFGLSKVAALDAQNTFGTFGKAAGLTGTDLSGFSQKLTGLAGDLASFKGTSTEQAIDAIGSALRGESDPIEAYGVQFNAATIQQEAFRQGLISNIKTALTPQQKTLATTALLFSKTKDAQGDYARTSTSTANTQKTLSAEIENAQVKLGARLAPALTIVRGGFLKLIQGSTGLIDTLGVIADKVTPIVGAFVNGIGPALSTAKDAFAAFVRAIPVPVLQTVGAVLGTIAVALGVQAAATVAASAATAAYTAVKGLFITTTSLETGATERGLVARLAHNVALAAGAVVTGVSAAATGVATVASYAFAAAQTVVNAVLAANPIALVVLALVALVAGFVLAYKKSETFRDIVQGAFGAVKDVASGFADFFTKTIPDAFNTVKDKVSDIVSGVLNFVRDHFALILAVITGPIGLAVLFVVEHFDTIKTKVADAVEAVRSRVADAFDKVKTAISTALSAAVGFVTALPGNFITGLGNLGQKLYDFFNAAFTRLEDAVTTVGGAVTTYVTALPGNLITALGNLGQRLYDFTLTAWNRFDAAVDAAVVVILAGVTALPGKLISSLGALGQKIYDFAKAAWDRFDAAVDAAVVTIKSTVGAIPAKIVGALGNLGSLLVSEGGDLIAGFVRGIRNSAGSVVAAIRSSITDKLPDFVKKALGINSPSKVFAKLGGFVGEGFANGISGSQRLVDGALGRLTDVGDVAGMRLGDASFVQDRLGIDATPGGADVVAAIERQTARMEQLQDRLVQLQRTGAM